MFFPETTFISSLLKIFHDNNSFQCGLSRSSESDYVVVILLVYVSLKSRIVSSGRLLFLQLD